jgi:GT2 family glycosyltransferase
MPFSQKRVSIIIVNWKTPKLLASCLDSIFQDANSGDFEICVVDNDSQDESLDLIQNHYGSVHLIANTSNVGFSKAVNQAIPVTSGKYILLLNPDTHVQDQAISKLADFMDLNQDCGACGPRVLNPDGSLQLACRRSFPDPWVSLARLTYLSRLFPNNKSFAQYNLTFEDENKLLEVDALSGSAMMVRRDVIDQIGLLDEEIFMYGEDIDWCWRVKEHGYKVFYIPEARVYHFHGASSRLRPIGTTLNLHRGMEVFYRKHLAAKYPAPFNWCVYTAIWTRALIFTTMFFLASLFRMNKKVPSSVLPVEYTQSLEPRQADRAATPEPRELIKK